MKYDQVILEKNAYYEILNIKWRYEFIKVHGKQEVLRYGKYTKSSSNRMWVCRLYDCLNIDAERIIFGNGTP